MVCEICSSPVNRDEALGSSQSYLAMNFDLLWSSGSLPRYGRSQTEIFRLIWHAEGCADDLFDVMNICRAPLFTRLLRQRCALAQGPALSHRMIQQRHAIAQPRKHKLRRSNYGLNLQPMFKN